MLPPQIAQEIARRSLIALSPYGLVSAHGVMPGTLPELPTLLVGWKTIDVSESNEQINELAFTGSLFTSNELIPDLVAKVDAMAMPLIDAFSPNLNSDNYHLRMANGDYVDFCTIRRAELSIPIVYNDPNKPHYGGRFYWSVKVRRYAGSE